MPNGAGGDHPAEDGLDRALRVLEEKLAAEAADRAKAAREQAKAREREARRHSRKSNGRVRNRTVVSVVTLALVGAGVLAAQHFGHGAGGPAAPLGQSSGPPADPFASTPADHWASGATGITVPAAHPAGTFTASQVAAAYATTRTLLIAQNLDQATLLGGPPTAFSALLTTKERTEFLDGLNKTGQAKDGSELSTRVWVASFAPGTTALIGNVIKVHGTMSARAATDHGSKFLAIDVNYRFVYPIEPPRAPADWMRVVGQVTGYVQFDNWSDPGQPLHPWVVTAFPDEAGTRCDTSDGYSHPEYPSSLPDKAQPSGTPIDPYSLKQNPSTSRCAATTGT